MLKNKLNYKLVNCALIMVIIYLIYRTGSLWMDALTKVGSLILPFVLAFAIAYILYPILEFLESKKISKGVSIALIITMLLVLFVGICVLVGPQLFNQVSSLFGSLITFLKEVSLENNLNLSGLESTLSNIFNGIIGDLGKVVSNGAFSIIANSISLLSILFIAFASSIYFLIDMDNIRKKTGLFLRKKINKKFYNYVKLLDHEMKSYLSGFVKIMFISFFEYTIAYTIIGHPDALLLGILAMVLQLIPYFGGIMNNILAAIVAFVVSPGLFVKTLILVFVLSAIDGNVISPLVYGKTNKIKPLYIIMSVFICGALFGIPGIIVAMPLTIFVATTLRYYENELKDKLEDIKDDLVK